MNIAVCARFLLKSLFVIVVTLAVYGCASSSTSGDPTNPPSITSLNPASGAVGSSVTITGANFGATQGTGTIKFNGTTATATAWSATSITATVPTGATTGNVVVTVGGQASNGASFTVTTPAPAITNLNPNSGTEGSSVAITGTNFGATQGSSTIKFNGTTATATAWSATSITATVPTGATTGNVVVTVGGQASNGASFTVTTPAPAITNLNPNSGTEGSSVAITGTNFGATQGSSTIKFNGTTATATAWSATSITATVPTGATTGNVVVTVGGQASNGASFTVTTPAPAITNLNPNSGTAGSSVVITGTNFGATQGSSTIKFNGTTATATAWSATSITATVPTGATTGNVVVTVGGQASNGASFTVTTPAPAITNLNPNSGTEGSSVVITGTNFGATQGSSTIKFNGTTATATAWSATSITATVPTGATTGNVVVTVGGQASNGASFTVTTPAPAITNLNPNSGTEGSSVAITGTNFGATQGSSTIKFNGTTATATAWSATSITATVPTGATTGNVVVTVGGQASNGASFTVTTPAPAITNLNPNSGTAGSSVVITGTNFGATQGSSTIKFNGTTATATAWSATSITATVPTGATTGNVVVTVGGQASNGASFTVTTPAPAITNLNPNSGTEGSSVAITGTNFGATQGSSTIKFNGTTATATAWSATSITATVPTGATTGNVVVTVGGQASNGASFTVTTPAPAITNLNPNSGAEGSSVVITGTNFGATQGSSTIKFNGTTATATAWSATSITATVPTGATTGNVVVTVGGQASNGASFTVTTPAPAITNLNPNSGAEGSSVVITGTNFGATQGSSTIKFNGTTATATAWSATSITATVPTGATTGNVVVTVGGQASNGASFTVTTPAPAITNLNPNSGTEGSSVVITGTNFGATQGSSTIKFNGTTATATAWSATSITATVPTGATTGNVVVTVGGQASNGASFTVTAGSITVSVSPKGAGLTVTQTLSVTATTNDTAGVTWAATGGGFSSGTSKTLVPVTYTAPSTAGSYTITATSVTDTSKTASVTVGVTDLAGVYSYHNDISRDGVNQKERALTTSNVDTSTFGKLFSCAVDGAVYAQPLWVANVNVNGTQHNIIVVATAHDSVYAFDADSSSCVQLWKTSLLQGSETTVPSGTSGNLVGFGSGDISPETGIIGTPVIDPSTSTVYVVGKSVDTSGPTFYQRLHALDLATGVEKTSLHSPGTIAFSGFNAQVELQRAGLALVNGVVYICWASHEDAGAYHGWVAGYSAANVTQSAGTFNVTPNGSQGGIWMSGGAPAVDTSSNLYVISGNGTFDTNGDYSQSFIKLGTGGNQLIVTDSFTPSNQFDLSSADLDVGSGGAAILVDLPLTAPHPRLIVGGGKGLTFGGLLYVLDRDSLGGYQQGAGGSDNVVQEFSFNHAIFATAAFWQNQLYISGVGGPLQAFALNPTTSQFATTPVASSSVPTSYGFPGATPSISTNGTTSDTTVVWALNTNKYCTHQSSGCGPAILYAYDSNLNELWDSTMASGDAAGNAVKFTVPTVANGKVYVGTRGNNTGGAFGSTTISGELDVYGLKSN